MSEREVRKYAWHKIGCRGATYLSLTRGEPQCSCGYEEASCQAPDVMVLLRKLCRVRDERKGRFEDTTKKTYTTDEVAGRSYDMGALDALSLTIKLIEKTVRLTADGWEWVEEGE